MIYLHQGKRMTDPDALEQQAHAALDMLELILHVDVTTDTDRGVELVSRAPLFEEEQ